MVYYIHQEGQQPTTDKEDKKMKYNVSLANNSCIFDNANDLTIEEILKFVAGRGGAYVVHIDSGDPNGNDYRCISLRYHSNREAFYFDDGWSDGVYFPAGSLGKFLAHHF